MIPPEPSPKPELILVAHPRAGIRVRDDDVMSIFHGVDLAPFKRLLQSAHAIIRPLYGVGEEWFIQRRYTSQSPISLETDADMSTFYKITCPEEQLIPLSEQLRELPIAQSAYLKPPVAPAALARHKRDSGETDRPSLSYGGDFTGDQEYLMPAVVGIDAWYAWKKAGGRGERVRIIDIEGAWRFSHEDLRENASGCVGGVPITSLKWRRHGTAVLGVLGGDHNTFGIAGICPAADINTVSVFGNSSGGPSANWSYAAAIRLAADMLRAGDIILIELHKPGPAYQFQERDDERGYIPIEWWPCNLAAIQYATRKGIIVVEAGGNGEQDLDDEMYNANPCAPYGPFPQWWKNPFRRKLMDSGAILVGAGAPPTGIHGSAYGVDRSRLSYSNFGCGIDTQGWGQEVATCGGNGNLTPTEPEEDRQYTRTFSGTSSASAMVAGALACMQGVMKTTGNLLTPALARTLLQDNSLNSPQQAGDFAPVSQHIGPRPDLRKLINYLVPPSWSERIIAVLKKYFFGPN